MTKQPMPAEHMPAASLQLALRSQLPALVPPATPTLSDLTEEIRHAHAEAIAALSIGAASMIRCGKALIAAKNVVKHGEWADYVGLECRLSLRTVQTYMFLAKHEDELQQLLKANPRESAYLTQAQALRFLSAAHKEKRRRKRAK